MANKKRNLKAIDLFSGCGGLTTGLKKAGFRVVAAVEVDGLAAETYQQNHPDTKLFRRDIRRLPAARLAYSCKLAKGRLDLLAACPPCQAYSSVRTLNGFKTVRASSKDLLFEVVRFARVLRPRAVMVENVPGLAKDTRWKLALQELEKLGYSCRYEVLDASEYGVPQRRRRLIMIAGLNQALPFGAKARRRLTVRDAFRGLKARGRSGDDLHDFPEERDPWIKDLIKHIPRNGGSRMQLPRKFQLRCHQSCTGFKDVYGRMKWTAVSPTITGGCVNPSKGRFLHPERNGAITLREAALLQSFPKSYYFSLAGGKHACAVMIGNALPPEFIRRHAAALSRCLTGPKRRGIPVDS
jgi:DNA (cytosine-5)-methyltransferase 1